MNGHRVVVTLHPPLDLPTVNRVLHAVIEAHPDAVVESGPVYRVLVPVTTSVLDGADAVGGMVGESGLPGAGEPDDDAQGGDQPTD